MGILQIDLLGGGRLRIEEGQTILEASLKAGIPHCHACGGRGQSSTCRILVNSGEQNFSPFNDKEVALRKKAPFLVIRALKFKSNSRTNVKPFPLCAI